MTKQLPILPCIPLFPGLPIRPGGPGSPAMHKDIEIQYCIFTCIIYGNDWLSG